MKSEEKEIKPEVISEVKEKPKKIKVKRKKRAKQKRAKRKKEKRNNSFALPCSMEEVLILSDMLSRIKPKSVVEVKVKKKILSYLKKLVNSIFRKALKGQRNEVSFC